MISIALKVPVGTATRAHQGVTEPTMAAIRRDAHPSAEEMATTNSVGPLARSPLSMIVDLSPLVRARDPHPEAYS
jgi:hypothetical protein